MSPLLQRTSIRRLRPTAQPASCSPCASAVRRACDSGSFGVVNMSTPMRRIRSPCCARAASGHATAATEERDGLAPFQLIELHRSPPVRAAVSCEPRQFNRKLNKLRETFLRPISPSREIGQGRPSAEMLAISTC